MTSYDAIVVGAGQAGPGVAMALAGSHKRVALIEMDQVGGTCLNHGCRPTKALRASAVAAHAARRASEYGVSTGEVTVDFERVMNRMHTMIDGMRRSVSDSLAQTDLEVVHGRAQLRTRDGEAPHQVLVGDQVLEAPEIYLDLGARALIPPLPGLDEVDVMTEVELLALDALPEHLIVVGGGYVGLEFSQMFRRFGAEVTVIAGGGLAPREDPDVSAAIEGMLTDEGVTVTKARVDKVASHDEGVEAYLSDGSTVVGSHLLLATGRASNLDLLGDEHGLEADDKGFLLIDSRFATSVPGVWALGDVNGHGAFTHTAYQDSQILLDASRTLDGRITAYAMFTDPPLGRVGMNEAEARESGKTVLKAEIDMSSVSRAVLDSETVGLIRILVDADSEEFLGATFLGMHGDEIAQLIGMAMQNGVGYRGVRDALPIHPTVAEFIPSMLASLVPLGAAEDQPA